MSLATELTFSKEGVLMLKDEPIDVPYTFSELERDLIGYVRDYGDRLGYMDIMGPMLNLIMPYAVVAAKINNPALSQAIHKTIATIGDLACEFVAPRDVILYCVAKDMESYQAAGLPELDAGQFALFQAFATTFREAILTAPPKQIMALRDSFSTRRAGMQSVTLVKAYQQLAYMRPREVRAINAFKLYTDADLEEFMVGVRERHAPHNVPNRNLA